MSYMMDNIDKEAEKLNSDYSKSFRKFCIKQCAINTVDEFIDASNHRLDCSTGFVDLVNRYEANLKLSHFDSVPLSKNMESTTIKILNIYNVIDENLTMAEKNSLDQKSKNVIASTF